MSYRKKQISVSCISVQKIRKEASKHVTQLLFLYFKCRLAESPDITKSTHFAKSVHIIIRSIFFFVCFFEKKKKKNTSILLDVF